MQIKKECHKRAHQPDFVSQSLEEMAFDNILGKIAVKTAVERHAGHYRREITPNRVLLYQTGKDLRQFKYVIGTGGILVNNHSPLDLLSACIDKNPKMNLTPLQPTFLLDHSYILSAMGLLSTKEPDIALRILKKQLISL